MEWISSTLSENNHTFLVCCGLWHEKPTFVASCGLMCLQNHTCVVRCGLVVASHACFPCKKSHPDPRTTRNFRHFRQGFKQDSKVRRLGRLLRLSNTGMAFGASLSPPVPQVLLWASSLDRPPKQDQLMTRCASCASRTVLQPKPCHFACTCLQFRGLFAQRSLLRFRSGSAKISCFPVIPTPPRLPPAASAA